MSIAPPKLLTAEEFAKLPDPPDGSRQALVRGEVVTMPPPSFVHAQVQGNIDTSMKPHSYSSVKNCISSPRRVSA